MKRENLKSSHRKKTYYIQRNKAKDNSKYLVINNEDRKQ